MRQRRGPLPIPVTVATVLGIVLLAIGAIVALAEIHTLTIYLIAVAVACFAAGGTALAGAGLDVTLTVLAVVILLGLPVARWASARLKNRASEEVTRDDVGLNVTVIDTEGGSLRVSYRGTTWDARLNRTDGPPARPGDRCRIVAREGNVLVLEPPADDPA
jgi:membrane protein implicated in regulation of membrane protease activity